MGVRECLSFLRGYSGHLKILAWEPFLTGIGYLARTKPTFPLPPQVPTLLSQTVPGIRVASCLAGQKKEREQVGKLPDMIPAPPRQNTVVFLLCRRASHTAPCAGRRQGDELQVLSGPAPVFSALWAGDGSLRADQLLPGASPCHPTWVVKAPASLKMSPLKL